MGIIRKLESTPRRIYTGSVGYLLPGRRALFNVAIRTLLLERERTASSGEMTAEYGVGGGIVWNSTEKSELEESRIKALVLTEEIPEFSLLETMLWTPEGGGYELLDLHIERLIGSGKYFSIRVNPEEVRRMLSDLAHRLRRVPHRVRLLVAEEGALSFDAQPWRKPPPDCRVRLAREPVASTNRFLYHKTTNRAVYDGALAQLSDCDDVLLWNERGELTESTIANLLLELDGEFVTPPVSSGLLPGVYREWMLRSGGARERVVTPADLRGAQRVFLMNSVRGKYEVRVLTEDEPGKGP
jgi:para-aminobenzoate synthetase/4-amino-4-deoxychorismate lyase